MPQTVRITQIDGALPNIALMKLAAWHRARGDHVVHTRSIEPDLFEPAYDVVYGSAIFSFSAELVTRFRRAWPNGILGGTGTDSTATVEAITGPAFTGLDYSGHPDFDASIGFSQRGCRLKCGFCLTPVSIILTNTGPKPISEVQVGDLVLTHMGRYRRVTEVLERNYSGPIYKLNSGALSQLFPTVVTSEHPVWMRRVSYRSGGQKLTSFKWLDAGSISAGHTHRSRDVFAYPRTRDAIISETEWPVTPELMQLIGWYLAEGYCTSAPGRGYHRTTFCLGHSDTEKSYAREIEQAAASCGLNARTYHVSIGLRPAINSVQFTRWLVAQFGTGASTKIIPLWVRQLPGDLLLPLVDAWIKGDGWEHLKKGTRTCKITTVSPALALALYEIVLKCGFDATINKHKSSDVIQGRKVNVKPSYTVIFRERRSRKQSIRSDEEFIYRAVGEAETAHYEGRVHNLEVEEDHSYCTPAFAVHNCVVPTKEGKNRSVATIADIWRGEGHPRKIHLLDNDFFGQQGAWRDRIDEIRSGGYRICMSQGINVRLIDDEVAAALATIEYRDTKFSKRQLYTAWDNLKDERVFFRGVDTLEAAGIPPSQLMAYMLVGYDPLENWERIWHRFNRMVERGIKPYPMVYRRSRADLVSFQRWVVTGLYRIVPWNEYVRSTRSPESTAAYERSLAGAPRTPAAGPLGAGVLELQEA